MNEKNELKKKSDIDLWIIFISTMLVIILYNSFLSIIRTITKNAWGMCIYFHYILECLLNNLFDLTLAGAL